MVQPYVPGSHVVLQPHEMFHACAIYYLLPTTYYLLPTTYYLLGVL